MTTISVNLGINSYDITVGRGILKSADKYFNLQRRVVILTDEGVPTEYSRTVAALAKDATVITLKEGEGTKSLETFAAVHARLVELKITRSDCLVAVGGGVVGDLCGFLASTYMRGIDFYNILTTLLSQIDSSIGGKTAVNHAGVKNIIGAFYQPKGVLIDTDVLKTLPSRQISSGLAEAIKMAATFDRELFEKFEAAELKDAISEDMITAAIDIKRRVVEADEREGGLRRVLNFGHTFGHAIEANEGMEGLYHGECVALGMTYTSVGDARSRLIRVLKKYGLPTSYNGDVKKALAFLAHDKKCEGTLVRAVFVEEIGSYEIRKISLEEFSRIILSAR